MFKIITIKEKKVEDQIVILGYLSDEDKFAYLQSSNVLILPSYEEGFGMVILEAMVYDKPTIAYDLPVFKEYFTQAVIPVQVGNKLAFARAIENYLSKKHHPKLASHCDSFDILKLAKQEINLILTHYEKKSLH